MTTSAVPLWIDGRATATGGTFTVLNPATEEPIAEVANADGPAVLAALAAAQQAFGAWSTSPLTERQAIVGRFIGLLERERERLIELLVAETGKPWDTAAYELVVLANALRFNLEEMERIHQEVIPDPSGRFLHYVLRQPLGVVVGLLAWNYPLLNLAYKLGPVLASGCTAVLKPSRHTPLATLALGELLAEAGLPAGVINFVAGDDRNATDLLLSSPVPALITMVGSTAGGLEVMKTAGTSIKRFSLELGGNAPAIVFPDADLQDAANRLVDLKFSNAGQICVAPNRCFVHADVLDEFCALAAARAARISLGSGRGDAPRMGPLMTAEARERVLGLIGEAAAEGAKLVCGGRRPAAPARGFYLEPTILRDVQPAMRVAREEIFGPVLPILSFTDDEAVLAAANDTPYGLAAYVFTASLARALRAGEVVQAGSVCINESHYGVHLPHPGQKQSGLGCDRSHYSLEEYLSLKRVSIRK